MKKNKNVNEQAAAEAVNEQAAAEAANEQAAAPVNETAVAVPAAPAGGTLAAAFQNASLNFLTSMVDDGTSETKAKIYNAMNDNDGNISDLPFGTIIEVEHFMAYPVTLENEEGEMIDAIRVVLVTTDGKSYGSVANGVFSSMQKIVAVCGNAPWQPAIKVTPVEKKTRKGFKTLTLRLVP